MRLDEIGWMNLRRNLTRMTLREWLSKFQVKWKGDLTLPISAYTLQYSMYNKVYRTNYCSAVQVYRSGHYSTEQVDWSVTEQVYRSEVVYRSTGVQNGLLQYSIGVHIWLLHYSTGVQICLIQQHSTDVQIWLLLYSTDIQIWLLQNSTGCRISHLACLPQQAQPHRPRQNHPAQDLLDLLPDLLCDLLLDILLRDIFCFIFCDLPGTWHPQGQCHGHRHED